MKKALWIIGSLSLAILLWVVFKPTSPEEKPLSELAARRTLRVTVSSTGTVLPHNRVEIKSPIPGRVEQVNVEEGASVKKGQILAYLSSTERAALLDLAHSQSPAAVKKWEGLYRPTPLVSPISGMVISRAVEPGQSVSAADPVVVLADTLIVKALVDESDIAKVSLQQKVTLEADAFPDMPIEGRVDHIAYEAQLVNNVTLYEVDITPLNAPSFFKSGMSVSAAFWVTEKQNALCIPAPFLQESGRGHTRVMTAYDKDKPVFTRVKVGLSDGKFVEILEGLQDGQAVYMPKPKRREKPKSSPFTPQRPPSSRSMGR